MTANISISRQGFVTDHTTGRDLGTVSKIDWPESRNGIVTTSTRWEARRPHETLVNSPFSFPTFTTRRAAAESLA